MRIPRWLWLSLIILVASMGATSFIVSIFNPSYQPPEAVYALFGAVVGGLVLGGTKGGNGNGNGG